MKNKDLEKKYDDVFKYGSNNGKSINCRFNR